MTRVNDNGITINGHNEDSLRSQLEKYYTKSSTAKSLLDQSANKKIELSNGIGKPRKEGSMVFLYWEENKKTGLHQYGPEELGETALFELKNLLNKPQFDQVRAPTFLEYGLKKAKIESESTLMIVTILKELQNSSIAYVPSAWGKKQIDELGGRTGNAAKEHIANTPHDSSQTNEFKMPSKYFYAYDRMLASMRTIDGLRIYLKNILNITSPSNKFYGNGVSKEVKNAFDKFKKYGATPQQIFIWLVYAARSIEKINRWGVDWKHNQHGKDYEEFADAVISVNITPNILPNTSRVNNIKAELINALT
jgi:hypothetical protein